MYLHNHLQKYVCKYLKNQQISGKSTLKIRESVQKTHFGNNKFGEHEIQLFHKFYTYNGNVLFITL